MASRWQQYKDWMANAKVIKRLWLVTILTAIYSEGVVALEMGLLHYKIGIHPNMHTVLGVFLGILLAFRNTTAYDRWWEGRKLWGQLVNDSRNLIIKCRALPRVELPEAQYVARLLVSFARALKEHLREGIKPKQLTLYQKVVNEDPQHVPLHLAFLIRERITQWRTDNKIDGFEEIQLDVHCRALMDICGACERIRKTPLSYSYLAFVRQMIFLYLITLPWGLVDSFGHWTVPAVVMAAYFLVGIELIAEEVGEPFGRGIDDLALDDICKGIEISLNEVVSRQVETPIESPMLQR
jgi:putative membrane protein